MRIQGFFKVGGGGFRWKNKVPDVFGNFPSIFFYTMYFPENGGFYTLDPLLWWLTKKYEDTGNLKGVNILKERTRSIFYILCSFSNIFNQKGNFHPRNRSPNMDMCMSTKNLTMDCYHLINTQNSILFYTLTHYNVYKC